MGLTKLINNGATFYYTRIVSLQLAVWVRIGRGGGGMAESGKENVEQLRVSNVLMWSRSNSLSLQRLAGQAPPSWRETCSSHIVSYSYTL
jgi:hypothetical protein